jgi:hypothetical protein
LTKLKNFCYNIFRRKLKSRRLTVSDKTIIKGGQIYMEKQPEISKSSEQILTEKREKITKALYLMLDWQRSEKIKEALLPRLNQLTEAEIDYCLKHIQYLDNQVQLRGPLAAAASRLLVENEEELKQMERIIGPKSAEELKKIMGGFIIPPTV